jgi:catechol 2,3-dioxygenase-like lactoylglutathione lyase family enzyme
VKVAHLHHVQLAMPAGGEAQARAFYQGILGIPEVVKPAQLARNGGCWFEHEQLRVHLGVDSDFRPARKAHPALVVTDLASLAAQLRAAGHACEPQPDFAGYQRLFVADPFGNRIELMACAG